MARLAVDDMEFLNEFLQIDEGAKHLDRGDEEVYLFHTAPG